MLPTFADRGDRLLCEHITPRLGTLARGDLVIAAKPTRPYSRRDVILKRVTAVAGDKVDGWTVPLGHVWLRGDNESQSVDSRDYGPVPVAIVHSVIVARVWPYNRVEWFYRERTPSHFDKVCAVSAVAGFGLGLRQAKTLPKDPKVATFPRFVRVGGLASAYSALGVVVCGVGYIALEAVKNKLKT